MSSVGIPEGTSYKDDDYCSCQWFYTASIPPITTLVKKCDACKQKEKQQGISPIEKAGNDNLSAILEKARELAKSGNDKKKLEQVVDKMRGGGINDD